VGEKRAGNVRETGRNNERGMDREREREREREEDGWAAGAKGCARLRVEAFREGYLVQRRRTHIVRFYARSTGRDAAVFRSNWIY